MKFQLPRRHRKSFEVSTKKNLSDNFNKNEIDIISLCNYDTLLPEALEKNFINSNDLETLKDWKKNPEKWKISHD